MQIKTATQKTVTFFKEVKLELKRVNWPTREATIKYTLVVLGVSIALAVYLGGLDLILNTLIKKIVL